MSNQREKMLNRLAIGVSIIVFIVVGMMRRIKVQTDIDFSFLPAVNAAINSTTTIILLLGLWMIKKKKIQAHRKLMTTAIVLSALFLVSYVLYHFTTPETKYGGEGVSRTIYLILLATHIVMAGAILPFILLNVLYRLTRYFNNFC